MVMYEIMRSFKKNIIDVIFTLITFTLTGQIYEGTSFIQLSTIAKCLDKEFEGK